MSIIYNLVRAFYILLLENHVELLSFIKWNELGVSEKFYDLLHLITFPLNIFIIV